MLGEPSPLTTAKVPLILPLSRVASPAVRRSGRSTRVGTVVAPVHVHRWRPCHTLPPRVALRPTPRHRTTPRAARAVDTRAAPRRICNTLAELWCGPAVACAAASGVSFPSPFATSVVDGVACVQGRPEGMPAARAGPAQSRVASASASQRHPHSAGLASCSALRAARRLLSARLSLCSTLLLAAVLASWPLHAQSAAPLTRSTSSSSSSSSAAGLSAYTVGGYSPAGEAAFLAAWGPLFSGALSRAVGAAFALVFLPLDSIQTSVASAVPGGLDFVFLDAGCAPPPVRRAGPPHIWEPRDPPAGS